MTTADDADDAVAMGAYIRRLRKARGLTLVQLAELTDLSHAFISQIERGVALPRIGSLKRLAIALGTSPIELLAAADARAEPVAAPVRFDIVQPWEGERTELGFGEGVARLLPQHQWPFTVLMQSTVIAEPGPVYEHAEREFLVVQAGRLVAELDGVRHEIEESGALFCGPNVRHRWWSADGGEVRLLVVKEQPGL